MLAIGLKNMRTYISPLDIDSKQIRMKESLSKGMQLS